MIMNVFRIVGDSLHLLAIVLLLVKIWGKKSAAGVSGKSQILFAMTYLCRYLDLFQNIISFYNSLMKIIFIGISLTTCYLVFGHFRSTYNRKEDSFRIELLILPAIVLAYIYNYDDTEFEFAWAFSIYLESVAILPQFFLIWKIGNVGKAIWCYIVALGLYRGFYILNWIERYLEEEHYDPIAIVAGTVQTMCYLVFFCLYAIHGCSKRKEIKYSEYIEDPSAPVFVISGKYALDIDKMMVVPVLGIEEKSVYRPADEKAPKTGLASFSEFSISLTPNKEDNSIDSKPDAGAQKAVTLVYAPDYEKSTQYDNNVVSLKLEQN